VVADFDDLEGLPGLPGQPGAPAVIGKLIQPIAAPRAAVRYEF
jgi:hypothetical protein